MAAVVVMVERAGMFRVAVIQMVDVEVGGKIKGMMVMGVGVVKGIPQKVNPKPWPHGKAEKHGQHECADRFLPEPPKHLRLSK